MKSVIQIFLFSSKVGSKVQQQVTQTQTLKQKLSRIGRVSSHLKMGIVGMANVGKSSTFNLLSKQSVPAENFPFCTIDPNNAILEIKDHRYDYLVKAFQPASKVGPCLHVIDIAGLVKGASEGYGLGNEFLGHIQQVDGLFQLVRAFEKESILHTEGKMNPIRDLEIISNELIAKDKQFIDKRFDEVERKVKKFQQVKNDSVEARDLAGQYQVMVKCKQLFQNNQWARFHDWSDTECQALNKLQLLTAKPSIYLINLSSEEYIKYLKTTKCKYQDEIKEWIQKNSPESSMILYSAEYEQNNIDSPNSKLHQIITEGYNLLNLIRFFTVGSDEVRSWTIRQGSKAPQAASVIHTDFEKGFISADVMSFDQFQKLGSDAVSKFNKQMRKEGKAYTVQDGDIVHFKCKIVK